MHNVTNVSSFPHKDLQIPDHKEIVCKFININMIKHVIILCLPIVMLNKRRLMKRERLRIFDLIYLHLK